ncbi:carbohydrate kinase [Kineococcus glutinatus]|uniref:Carbohydrate kinase n=1 Tax=Kineococcus glutinatus TaxID=1070872 RepID=A0ABP9H9S3_9ACTN
MRQHLRFLVVGEALVDVLVHADGRREQHPGGSPANVALTLARLGRATTLLTSIGDDSAGRMLQEWLAASHVDLDPRSIGSLPTSRSTAHLDDAGAARYELQVRWQLPAVEPPEADVVHIGSLATVLAPGCHSVRDIVERARPRRIISYDPNIRPALITDHERVRSTVEELAAGADIIKVSDEDLQWIDPSADLQRVADRWLSQRARMVVITRGASGAVAFNAAGVVTVEAPRVEVSDTVGAGDTLMGALLACLDAELTSVPGGVVERRRHLSRLSPGAMESILAVSVGAAAVTVSRAGTNPPWPHELLGGAYEFLPEA